MHTIIRFTRNIGAYSPGDSAGFEEPQAQSYIDNGYAERVSSREPANPAPAVPETVAPAEVQTAEAEAGAQAPADEPAPAVRVTRKGRAKS